MNLLTNKPKKNTRVSTTYDDDLITVHLTSMPKELPKQVKGLITNKKGTSTLSFRISPEAAQTLANQLAYQYITSNLKR